MTYVLQCQTNTVPDSLTITVGSMTYNITQPSLNNNLTISETDLGVGGTTVQCMWNVNGEDFVNDTTPRGTYFVIRFHEILVLMQ